MKNRIILLTCFLATTVSSFLFVNYSNTDSVLSSLKDVKSAYANPNEYPHYGNYGRDMMDCSWTVKIPIEGTVTVFGVPIEGEVGAEVSAECTNCAWDCNANGANNTCDPKSCPGSDN